MPEGAGAAPTLLVDAEWFAWARSLRRKDAVFAALAAELRRRCDVLLDRKGPQHLDPDDLASRWWMSRVGTKQLVVALWDLALAARLFEEERYAAPAVRALRNLARHNMAERGGGTCYGIPFKTWYGALDLGHASEATGVSLDLLLPFMQGADVEMVGGYLLRFLAKGEEHVRSGLRGRRGPGPWEITSSPKSLHNIPMIGKLGMGVLAAALERLGAVDAQKYMQISRQAALQYLEGGGHEEGVLVEGPLYGFACLRHAAVLGTILARRGDPAVWESPARDRVVETYAMEMIPCDGTINPQNDCYPVRITSWLLAVARHRKNGLARWLWERIVQPQVEKRWDAPVPWDDIRAPWWNGLVPHALASYDPTVRPRAPDEGGVPRKRYFAVRGLLDERTGWKRDDWFLSVTCCPDWRWRNRHGRRHTQADRGHYSLHALGEKLAIDSGYGNELLCGSTDVIRFGYTGEAHNVPEVDGTLQKEVLTAKGFTDVLLEGWATAARMDFARCYPSCTEAVRVIALVPGPDGRPLYLAVYDRLIPRIERTYTFSSLLHTDEANRTRIVDRETADILGGRRGNRCRVVATAHRPGRFTVESFLGHDRLRFQNQGKSYHGLTLLVPYGKREKPPVFRRSDPDNAAGFAATLSFRGVTDAMLVCAQGTLKEWRLETDAAFTLVRRGPRPRLIMVEGSFLKTGGVLLSRKRRRSSRMVVRQL